MFISDLPNHSETGIQPLFMRDSADNAGLIVYMEDDSDEMSCDECCWQ